MIKYILGVIVIIVIAAGGYYAYTEYGNVGNNVAPEDTTGATTDDQVQAQEVTVGTGDEATPGSVVSVLYEGRLVDGTVFDSSAARDNEPLTFQLGTPGIIAGFQIGVNGMKVGGERLIAIPPAYGYGEADVTDDAGSVIIPGDSTLVFAIRLVGVEPPPAEAAFEDETADSAETQ